MSLFGFGGVVCFCLATFLKLSYYWLCVTISSELCIFRRNDAVGGYLLNLWNVVGDPFLGFHAQVFFSSKSIALVIKSAENGKMRMDSLEKYISIVVSNGLTFRYATSIHLNM